MNSLLPLSPFEEYMLLDDRPEYPMNIVARLNFNGTVDQQAAESAFGQVVIRHRLCRARVAEGNRGQLEWTTAETSRKFYFDDRCCDEGFFTANRIDLYSESGFSLHVGNGGQRSTAIFLIHHSCCDGIGLFQIVEDWLLAYNSIIAKTCAETFPRPIDESRLHERGRCRLDGANVFDLVRHHLHGGERARMFFMHGPAPLFNRLLPLESAAALPSDTSRELDADGFRDLRSRTKDHGVTLNTMFLHELFVAVGRFQSRRQQTPDRAWIRMAVPINMRTPADRSMPAANKVSMVFVDRRRREIADTASLLAGIHNEMQIIKRNNLGLTFLTALRIVKFLPGGIERIATQGNCSATCVLSNLGEPLEQTALPRNEGKILAGNLLLDSFDFLPPIRPGTAAAFGVFSYAGALRISLNYDSRYLSSTDAGQLLDGYLQQLSRRSRSAMATAATARCA